MQRSLILFPWFVCLSLFVHFLIGQSHLPIEFVSCHIEYLIAACYRSNSKRYNECFELEVVQRSSDKKTFNYHAVYFIIYFPTNDDLSLNGRFLSVKTFMKIFLFYLHYINIC